MFKFARLIRIEQRESPANLEDLSCELKLFKIFDCSHFPFGTIGVFAAKIRSLQKLVAYRRRELRIRK